MRNVEGWKWGGIYDRGREENKKRKEAKEKKKRKEEMGREGKRVELKRS